MQKQVCSNDYQGLPGSETDAAARQVFAAYQIPTESESIYSIDQLVPGSLGGSNDLANLWPQPVQIQPGPAEKDQLENTLRDQVCAGKVSLEDAQRSIALNWLAEYQKMNR
jgi:hypothetical protein